MTRNEAFDLFEELTEENENRDISLDLFRGKYTISISGPAADGGSLARIIQSFEEEGFETFVAGTGLDLLLVVT